MYYNILISPNCVVFLIGNFFMSNNQLFQFGTQQLSVQLDTNGTPWFRASDVCEILEYLNHRTAIANHVDEEDVLYQDTLTSGGPQQVLHINESGLYALTMGSKKEEAKQFKRWITSEVLPTIRKTGSYQSTPQTYIEALEAHIASEKQRVILESVNNILSETVLEQKPKVALADAFMPTTNLRDIGAVVKHLGYGRNKAMAILRFNSVLMKVGKDNVPTQKFMNGKIPKFQVITTIINNRRISTTYCTPAGEEFLADFFKRYEALDYLEDN